VLQHVVTLDVNRATRSWPIDGNFGPRTESLNPLCAPIKPSKILESMASLAIGRGGLRWGRRAQPSRR
jgi:hypothetical protein